jgi:hypothetical protein
MFLYIYNISTLYSNHAWTSFSAFAECYNEMYNPVKGERYCFHSRLLTIKRPIMVYCTIVLQYL